MSGCTKFWSKLGEFTVVGPHGETYEFETSIFHDCKLDIGHEGLHICNCGERLT